MAKVFLDPLAPNTNFILGAALAGGDPYKAAAMLGTGECSSCGEVHPEDRCPWLETCSECGRLGGEGTGIDMAADRLCCDCAEQIERARIRQEREAVEEGRGDYLRDQQKDDALEGRHSDLED